MIKKTLLLSLLAFPAFAGTTISTTLTLTSPSAIISMTGVSSTAYLKNIVVSNSTILSATATTLQLNTRNLDKALPCAAFVYDMVAASTKASTTLISSITRNATGLVGVSGTFPSTAWPMCMPMETAGAVALADLEFNISPSSAGFQVGVRASNPGSLVNSAALTCFVYCQ